MATQQFINDHHRPDRGSAMGRTRSLQFFVRNAQRSLAANDPGDAGPTHRNASHDARRRHLTWLQNQAYLAALADYRAQELRP